MLQELIENGIHMIYHIDMLSGLLALLSRGLLLRTAVRLYSTPYAPDSRSSSGHISGTTMYGIYTSVRCMANAWIVSAHGIMPPEA